MSLSDFLDGSEKTLGELERALGKMEFMLSNSPCPSGEVGGLPRELEEQRKNLVQKNGSALLDGKSAECYNSWDAAGSRQLWVNVAGNRRLTTPR